MGVLQAKYSSGLPCPPPGDLPNPGIKPMSLMSLALAGFLPLAPRWKQIRHFHTYKTNGKWPTTNLY